MKIIKISKKEKSPTSEMKEWSEKRTKRHIDLVSKYCNILAEKDERFKKLKERAKVHDKSKFEEPECSAYVWVNWKYRCKDQGWKFEDYNPPEDIDDMMLEATTHHVLSNSHHPEFHSPNKENVINKENRDAPPEKMVDATKMPDLDIAEMVCDWCGVSEERGNTPKSWADKNVNVRWKFTKEQSDLIYELIDIVWG